ncbi:uncharacterized protein LOC141690135 isoform X1 [Apium graveolens]|uniref:uncharacterized protein LOC141690135 isoform X1 n=1 Tax=Apium graveolens TaxID=4045 RepID=UPI003D78C2ED
MQLEETTRSGNHDTIQDNPTVLQQILELLRQQTANLTQQQEYQDNPSVLQQILELLRQQTANLTQQQEHQEDHVVTFKTFQYVNPPEFKGYEGPIEAMAWLKEIEKALAIVRVGEAQKTVYASYFLKGEANYWWEYKKALEDAGMITWERFTELFLEKYFPRYMWNQMEIEFLELKQENINVAEYETKFMELARFFPEYVNTDEKMAKRFQQGLKPWIRREVALFELKTYAAVVQKAMIIEGENDWSQDEKYNKKRKSRTQEASQQPRNFRNRYNRRPEFQEGRNENFIGHEIGNVGQGNRLLMVNQQRPQKPLIPECGTCGKKHAGVCNKTNVVCYKCNHRGHYANECQNVKPRVAAACHKCGNVGHYARDCKAPVPGNNMLRVTGPPQLEYEGCCTKLKRGCWMFLGSVSNYCSNHAVSPVMIVKSTS